MSQPSLANLVSLESLDRRLRLLEDIEAIRTLRMKYHQHMNESTFDQIEALYTDDAVVVLGTHSTLNARGREEIKKLFGNLSGNVQFLKQFIHNHLVDVKGDEAEGISYLDARITNNNKSLMAAASLKERYRRTDAGWRISETLAQIHFAVPMPADWITNNK